MRFDLDGKLWSFFWMEGWKIHLCPAQLVDALYDDYMERHPEGSVIEVKGTDDIWWDPGGMMMTDRSYQKIKIDTGTLTIATCDFGLFTEKLSEAPLRTFKNGQQYYKIHGWLHCPVFTPEQRDMLLQTCQELLPAADLKAGEEHREFMRRLEKINEGGMKVISARDPNMDIKRGEDGKISVRMKVQVEGMLSGTPTNDKN